MLWWISTPQKCYGEIIKVNGEWWNNNGEWWVVNNIKLFRTQHFYLQYDIDNEPYANFMANVTYRPEIFTCSFICPILLYVLY